MAKKRKLGLLLAAMVVLIGPSVVSAGLYKWTDENGQVHFSQTPPPDQDAREFANQESKTRMSGDLQCCRSVQKLAIEAASAMQRGARLGDFQKRFPAHGHAQVLEIVNFVSDRRRGGLGANSIGSLAYQTCTNAGFNACRVIEEDEESGQLAKQSSGTGFLVAPGFVVTNRHVVGGCKRITTGKEDRELFLKATDNQVDLALMTGQPRRDVNAKIASGEVSLGEAVTVAGFPLRGMLAEQLNVTDGTVSSLAGVGGDARLFQMTAPVQPGNSGGPVLNTLGQVVGVVVSRLNDATTYKASGAIPQNVNFAIRAKALRAFLKSQSVDYLIDEPAAEKTGTELASLAQSFTIPITCIR